MRLGSLYLPIRLRAALRDVNMLLAGVLLSSLLYSQCTANDGPTTENSAKETKTLFGLPEDRKEAVLRVIDEGKNRNQTLKH